MSFSTSITRNSGIQHLPILLTCLLILSLFSAVAQAPQFVNYQAVVRDSTGVLITNQSISIRASIIQDNPGGTIVYQETHSPTSNEFGLINLSLGSGTVVIGAFNTIDWSNGPYFTSMETDETGGTNYSPLGQMEMLSVPYALYAENAPGDDMGNHSASQNVQYKLRYMYIRF